MPRKWPRKWSGNAPAAALAFEPDWHGIIGNLDWVGLRDVGLEPNPDYGATVPHQAFMLFQMMFAEIAF